MFDFKGLFFMHSIHVYNRTRLEKGVELHGHAETTKHHVSVAVLGAKCLVGDFKTWRTVNGAINSGDLKRNIFAFIQ